jgi:5-methyltetrahydrofolate--homocysteine methyltransferase
MFNYDELTAALISGKAPVVRELTEKALAAGERPQDVLNNGLVAGMSVVGEKFKNNEFYVPEVLIAARAMKNGMEILRPKLAETGVKPKATVAIGTVRGDLHDIGKNLVAMMMEGAELMSSRSSSSRR